ncbi:MAG: hypothetical protein J6U92_04395 [Clostridia bacterium]|nr:hypothetical protein [Clostridia bacterium]
MKSIIKAPQYSEEMFAVRIPGYEFDKDAQFEISNYDYLVIQERVPHTPVFSSYNQVKYLNKKSIPGLQCKLFAKKVNCAIFAIKRQTRISSYVFRDFYCTTAQSKSPSDEAEINLIIDSYISIGDKDKFFKTFIFDTDFQYYTYKNLYNLYSKFANEAMRNAIKKLDIPVRTYNLNKEYCKGLDEEENKLYKAIKNAIKTEFDLLGLNVDFVICSKRKY